MKRSRTLIAGALVAVTALGFAAAAPASDHGRHGSGHHAATTTATAVACVTCGGYHTQGSCSNDCGDCGGYHSGACAVQSGGHRSDHHGGH